MCGVPAAQTRGFSRSRGSRRVGAETLASRGSHRCSFLRVHGGFNGGATERTVYWRELAAPSPLAAREDHPFPLETSAPRRILPPQRELLLPTSPFGIGKCQVERLESLVDGGRKRTLGEVIFEGPRRHCDEVERRGQRVRRTTKATGSHGARRAGAHKEKMSFTVFHICSASCPKASKSTSPTWRAGRSGPAPERTA